MGLDEGHEHPAGIRILSSSHYNWADAAHSAIQLCSSYMCLWNTVSVNVVSFDAALNSTKSEAKVDILAYL